jgi:hypothetical protein
MNSAPSDLRSKKTNNGCYGNAVTYENVATVGAFTTADTVQPLLIPAGTKLTGLVISADDLDTGAAAVGKIGFVYADGSAVSVGGTTDFAKSFGAAATADNAFGAGISFQAQLRTQPFFHPYFVEKDLIVTITPTTNAAAFQAGKVSAHASGILQGVN